MTNLKKIYESFSLPPFSNERFEGYIGIIDKALNLETVNIYTFKSAGITSRLKYILNNKKLLGDDRVNSVVFIFIDLQKYLFSQDIALSESLLFFDNKPAGELDLTNYFTIIQNIIREGKKIVFVVGDGGLLYFDKDPQCIALVNALRIISYTDINFIFVNQKDNTQIPYDKLDIIGGFFNKNNIFGKELFFSTSEIKYLLENEGKKIGVTVPDNITSIVGELSEGDPKVAIYLFYRWKENKEETAELFKKTPAEIYQSLDAMWLDARYTSIIGALNKNTLEDLLSEKYNDYLNKIGIGLYMNPMFNYFLTTRMVTGESKEKKRLDLTGQEQILFNLFSKFKDETITRDDISEALWGDKAEENYSDWAINKVISELRKKIAPENLEIKTVKNVGYILRSK